MPSKKKQPKTDQSTREAEILNAPIDTSNQVVNALMSDDFVRASNLDASQIALLLQELVRGQNSLLAQQSEQIAKIQARQDQIDREMAARMEEQKKFIEEVLERSETIKRTGDANDKLIAQGVAQYQAAITKARAEKISDDLAFKMQLQREPKVWIISPGRLATTMENGQQITKIVPEEVHIKNLHLAIPIGERVEVPITIANYLEERRASQKETAQRAELLSKNLESTKLAEAWNNITGSSASPMPT